jgi:hypothetical protein
LAHDAFISYSREDKLVADEACAALETAGIRCWIAPRDISPGSEWGAAIVDAIDHSAVMVLIFSSNANESRQIRREIEHAVSKGVTIVPVRIDQAEPTGSLAYFMAGVHWLDALTPPLENHLQVLVNSTKALLRAAPVKPPGESGQTQPDLAPAAILELPAAIMPGPNSRQDNREQKKKERPQGSRASPGRSVAVVSLVVALLFVVVVASVLVPRQATSPPMETPVAPYAAAKNSATDALQKGDDVAEIDKIADTMVRLCVGGGHTEATGGSGSGGADVSLHSFDVKGNVKGEFKINKSSAEGLINGLDNALGHFGADQADMARTCLQPVRERLQDVMLPQKGQGAGQTVTAPGGVAVGGDVKGSVITINPPAQPPGR